MSTGDLPAGTAGDGALSFDEGVNDISNLLGDPVTDLKEEDQESNEADKDESDTDEVSEQDAETDEDSDEEANADEDDESDAEDEDGPDDTVSGGKFAADDAKVTLADGKTITVAELKRNNLFQSDYTRKTEELKAEKTEFQAVQQRVDEVAQSLVNQREFLQVLTQKFVPEAPDRALMREDPLAYMEAKAEYDERMAELNQLFQFSEAEKQRMDADNQKAVKDLKAKEQAKLLEYLPELGVEKSREAFRSEMNAVGAEYGFSAEELGNVLDHRIYRVLKDVIAFQKLKKAAPKAKETVQNKPPLIKGGKRMDPKAKETRERQVADERLRKTGSVQAGIEALMKLDL